MNVRAVREFLDGLGARYLVAQCSPAYAAREIAANPDWIGWAPVDTVLVTLDGRFAMAVTPGGARLDLERLEGATGARAAPATEEQLARRFVWCEVGALPPLGRLFNLPVYLHEPLAGRERIAFFAARRTEMISMLFRDYFRLVEPRLVELCGS